MLLSLAFVVDRCCGGKVERCNCLDSDLPVGTVGFC
jgi:hypothetical protein